jgi:hypothetical protein
MIGRHLLRACVPTRPISTLGGKSGPAQATHYPLFERHSEGALHLFKFGYLVADSLIEQCKK